MLLCKLRVRCGLIFIFIFFACKCETTVQSLNFFKKLLKKKSVFMYLYIL